LRDLGAARMWETDAVETVLELRRVEKRFGGVNALNGVDLDLRAGEILGLLGPNGAGKTTLVRAIIGRVRIDAGSIEIHRGPVGWVPQEIALYPLLTVDENLATFGRYSGLRDDALRSGVDEALEWSGLRERRTERTNRLSGGMKRRLNMAAGVMHQPRIVLMDEPTVGVDPQSREKIYAMIEQMRTRGVAVIYTTHYMEEAERLCDRIAVIDHGRIIALGTRDELVRSTIGPVREARIELDGDIPLQLAESIRARGGSVDGRMAVLPVSDRNSDLAALMRELEGARVEVRDFSIRQASLQTVFLHLTGRELRE
jgi:ABC-2 type transport system ATP-binding protein